MIDRFSNSVHGLNDLGDQNIVVRHEDHRREPPLVREVLPQPVSVDPEIESSQTPLKRSWLLRIHAYNEQNNVPFMLWSQIIKYQDIFRGYNEHFLWSSNVRYK